MNDKPKINASFPDSIGKLEEDGRVQGPGEGPNGYCGSIRNAVYERMPVGYEISVVLITYNHAPYVMDALKSIAMQKVNVPFELIIGDDASKDGTVDIIRAFAEEAGFPVTVALRNHNHGMMPNVVETIHLAQGRYVALLEGDDFWIDPFKLQKQYDYLNANPDCSACFHSRLEIHFAQNTPIKQAPFLLAPRKYGIHEAAERTLMHLSSILYRRSVLPELPGWFRESPLGDWAINLTLAERGLLGCLPDPMSVYRLSSAGSWSNRSSAEKSLAVIRFLNIYDSATGSKYRKHIKSTLGLAHYKVARSKINAGMFDDDVPEYFWKYLRTFPGIGGIVKTVKLWRHWRRMRKKENTLGF